MLQVTDYNLWKLGNALLSYVRQMLEKLAWREILESSVVLPVLECIVRLSIMWVGQ